MRLRVQYDDMYFRLSVFRIVKYSCFISIMLFTIHIVAAIFLDPFQIFHKSSFDNRLNTNMREQAAGIINTFNFDSIILGTSRLQNFSSREASKKVGGNFVNISIRGSSFYERHFVLRYALKKNIFNIIYSIDPDDVSSNENTFFSVDRWTFLYDESTINDLCIYLSKKYLFKIYNPISLTQKVDIDRPTASLPSDKIYGLENWILRRSTGTPIAIFINDLSQVANNAIEQSTIVFDDNTLDEMYKGMIAYMRTYILDYVANHPNTNFFFVVPPMHRFFYAYLFHARYLYYVLHAKTILYLVDQSIIYKNMFVFAFEDMDFLDDFENYRDTGHYHPKIDSFILDCIAQRTHMLTPENVQRYLDIARIRAENFDFVTLNNRVKELMATKSAQKHQ